jgi:hypothetical protein
MNDSGKARVQAQLRDVRKLIDNTEKRLADLRTQLTEEVRGGDLQAGIARARGTTELP